jgi:membrane protein
VGERLSARRPVRFLKQLGRELLDDNLGDAGAMLAYYAILALFPMLVFVATIASFILDEATVQEGVAMATNAMPLSTRAYIGEGVARFMNAADGGLAIGGAALALWGASRGAAALTTALNQIMNLTETRSWIRRQMIAVGMTLAVAVLVVLALALLVAGPIAGHWISDRFGYGATFDVAWNIGRWIGAGLLVMVVWGLVYRFLPNQKPPPRAEGSRWKGRFRIFTPGAAAGIALWLAISWAFSVYLGYFNSYETTYGALGTAIIFLTWLWLSNIALLFGAEVNDVLARERA